MSDHLDDLIRGLDAAPTDRPLGQLEAELSRDIRLQRREARVAASRWIRSSRWSLMVGPARCSLGTTFAGAANPEKGGALQGWTCSRAYPR